MPASAPSWPTLPPARPGRPPPAQSVWRVRARRPSRGAPLCQPSGDGLTSSIRGSISSTKSHTVHLRSAFRLADKGFGLRAIPRVINALVRTRQSFLKLNSITAEAEHHTLQIDFLDTDARSK